MPDTDGANEAVNEDEIAESLGRNVGDDTSDDSLGFGEGSDTMVIDSALAEAMQKHDGEREAHLRTRADFANYKRRTEEEKDSLRQYLSADLLTRLLPIVDNFERALLASETTKDYDKLVGGINAVYRQLQDLLVREGVETVDALYQPFDPNIHNAVLREETTEYPENTVVEELQKGYVLKGRVLRPTMVKVSAAAE